jgi:hypothetical protein
MTGRDTRRAFVSRPSDPGAWVRSSQLSTPRDGVTADQLTARLTIDVTPELRGCIKVAAFQPGITVAEMLRDVPASESLDYPGGIA